MNKGAARAWVANEAAVQSLSGSKLAKQWRVCPAFEALASNPRTLAQMSRDVPPVNSVVKHPNFRNELESLKINQPL